MNAATCENIFETPEEDQFDMSKMDTNLDNLAAAAVTENDA